MEIKSLVVITLVKAMSYSEVSCAVLKG